MDLTPPLETLQRISQAMMTNTDIDTIKQFTHEKRYMYILNHMQTFQTVATSSKIISRLYLEWADTMAAV